jgi:flagellar basal-body rod protein FlgB
MSGFDSTINGLNTTMNLRLVNQNVITSNVANADTPGYKAKKVEFEGALRQALEVDGNLPLEGDSPEHMIIRAENNSVSPAIADDMNGIESLDGNTVDRSAEMAKMAENQLLYDAAAEMLKKKLGMLKYSITEGGGNR